MIECIFTLDYEIYGNGTGTLRDLVHRPTATLRAVFKEFDARFVLFPEVAELEMIEERGTDSDIGAVSDQIRQFHEEGFEVGLHIHPWWYNAHYGTSGWQLDHSEYNLCVLAEARITEIVDRSIGYLRNTLRLQQFTPLAFRAGHLLLQPSRTIGRILAAHGIRVDSSVYKGGLWRQHGLDYRPALRNGDCWMFRECAAVPDPGGVLLEIPIYSRMVPTWTMLTSKRIGLERKGSSVSQTGKKLFSRYVDFFRMTRPLKFDFCHMTLRELIDMLDRARREDQRNPETLKPIVAIGHSKELVDFETIRSFLAYLHQEAIPVSTYADVYSRCWQAATARN